MDVRKYIRLLELYIVDKYVQDNIKILEEDARKIIRNLRVKSREDERKHSYREY